MPYSEGMRREQSTSRSRAASRAVRPLVSGAIIVGCCLVFGRLTLAALSEPSPQWSSTPVDITTSGRLDTRGMGDGGQTISTLTVTNEGGAPVRWVARPEVSAPSSVAESLTMTGWLPASGTCGAQPATMVPLTSLAPPPLAAGSTATVCVVLTLPEHAARIPGIVSAHVTFTATPA